MKTKRQVKSRYINVNIINYKKDLIKLMFSTFSSHVPQKNQAGVHDPHPALGLLTQQHPHSAKMKKKKNLQKKTRGRFVYVSPIRTILRQVIQGTISVM